MLLFLRSLRPCTVSSPTLLLRPPSCFVSSPSEFPRCHLAIPNHPSLLSFLPFLRFDLPSPVRLFFLFPLFLPLHPLSPLDFAVLFHLRPRLFVDVSCLSYLRSPRLSLLPAVLQSSLALSLAPTTPPVFRALSHSFNISWILFLLQREGKINGSI